METLDSDAVKAPAGQTVALDAKCSYESALYCRHAARLGHTAWAHPPGTLGTFSARSVQTTEGKLAKATVFRTVASRKKHPQSRTGNQGLSALPETTGDVGRRDSIQI